MGGDETTSLPRPKCPNCNHVGAIGARFCSNCGFRLDASVVADATGALPGPAADGPTDATGEAPASGAVLIVDRGADRGTRFPLEGDIVTVGRSNESDVFLDDVTVSRNHAELLHGSSSWVVRDKRSLNGTYVNGDRMEEARLNNGDRVQIGKFVFTFWAAE